MTAEHIIGIYVVIAETMRVLGHASHRLAEVSDAEVLTVAVVAAAFFANHHARAPAVLRATGYLARVLCVSRFSRRLHALADWLALLLDVHRTAPAPPSARPGAGAARPRRYPRAPAKPVGRTAHR
jgi:hypothetical protein